MKGCVALALALVMLAPNATIAEVPQSATRLGSPQPGSPQASVLTATIMKTEHKTVKLYGAGGVAGLEAYQSGFFISEQGHILTVWSTVLDVDVIIAVTSDGRKLEASLLGIDPNLEIAVLQTKQPEAAYFALSESTVGEVGERVLALSNLFGIASGREMASVQKGIIMAKTRLDARRGTFPSVYQGPVLVVDAMTNNPGAAGGALVDFQGRLLGMLGKELRDARANIWLNYAIPIKELRESVERILAGKSIDRNQQQRKTVDRPHTLVDLGIVLVPDVLSKTPPYVDLVRPGSAADRAGLKNDDLILFVNSTRIGSQAALRDELVYLDRGDRLLLLIQRGNELKELALSGE